ncbi:hypothetical protein [Undibacterium sp. Ji22W]|uniref:hypothetical protein n=1 Tax=Undibacterium sp. Ji22W TaxID=3413038 RepID=UPI003BF1C754
MNTQNDMRAYLASPEYKKSVREKLALMEKEEQVLEDADWFGKTGLSDSIERELPRYLRREYGMSIFDKDALKADHLTYLGVFPEGSNSHHFWRIHDGAKEAHYAYVTISANGDESLGWGSRLPPALK